MIIKAISELRNNYPTIESLINQVPEPVFLTKNGEGSSVIMSIATYTEMEEKLKYLQDKVDELSDIESIYGGLLEAQIEARKTNKRYSLEELLKVSRSSEGLEDVQDTENRVSYKI